LAPRQSVGFRCFAHVAVKYSVGMSVPAVHIEKALRHQWFDLPAGSRPLDRDAADRPRWDGQGKNSWGNAPGTSMDAAGLLCKIFIRRQEKIDDFSRVDFT
jgi:hypothetical protein